MLFSIGHSATRIGALIFLILAAALVPAAELPQAAAYEELVLEVRVNGQDLNEMLVVLRDESGGYWLDAADFARLRLNPPIATAHEQGQRRYLPLSALRGAQLSVDASLSRLDVQAPAGAFLEQRIAAPNLARDAPAPAATGMFANYQLSAQRIGSENSGGAYAELGLFSNYGVLTSSTAARYVAGVTHNVRLDTTLTRDFPSNMQTLTLGDSVTDPGAWGSALRFAGVRFARNFGIRPDLVTTPLLTASGSAVVPSAVDVFVNNQRVYSQQVQPGPFTIDQLPAVTGAGDVNIVVRDALGREQVLTQSFYSSPVLLAAGLNQYSFASGKIRENYALTGFDYGPWTGGANFRHGFNDYLTMEAHAEYLQDQGHAAGLDGALRLGNAGVATATLAAGGDSSDNGWLGGLGFERVGQRASFGLGARYATQGFHRAATFNAATAEPRLAGIAHAGLSLGRAGTVAFALAGRKYYDGRYEQTVSLTHSVRVGNAGNLNLLLSRDSGARPASSGFLTFSTALGSRRSFESTAEGYHAATDTRQDLRASMTQAAPVGLGSGWRISAAQSGNYDALWQQRMPAVDLELQAARSYGTSGQNLQLRGGATWLDGSLRAMRAVDSSFAVVDVDGIAGIPVYVENQLVTHTDAHGRALLHNLISYEPNRISIAPEDLPLNTSVDSRSLVIQPAYRSGVIARFPVQHISPAVFRLHLADGSPVPAGASVQLNGGTFPVALEGMTYVTTLDHGVGGTATWTGGRCTFRVESPPVDDPMPDMGDIVCRTATPGAP